MKFPKKQFMAQCVFLAALILASGVYAAYHVLERINVSSAGSQATGPSSTGYNGGPTGNSYSSSLSESGRYITFASGASNLVANDTNNKNDIFVRDRTRGTTERINISSAGGEANDWSSSPAISGDGRYIAFASRASNLVTGDTNNLSDIFVRDRTNGTTERISINSQGEETSGSGYSSSWAPAISGDGRYVAFESGASNLVTGDTNNYYDIFVRDRTLGTTERVNISSAGGEANADWSSSPAISGDGRYVAFESGASNLVSGDTNNLSDIFVRDRTLGTTERVSVSTTGDEANNGSSSAAISRDGRYVAFSSRASNLVANDTNNKDDIFVRDRTLGTTERVNVSSAGDEANDWSYSPSISGDGRYIAFESGASNLVTGDTNNYYDVFVRDRTLGTTERINVSSAGDEANNGSSSPAISGDGRYIVFGSYASNLIAGDTNNLSDIFMSALKEKNVGFNWAAFLPSLTNMGKAAKKQ